MYGSQIFEFVSDRSGTLNMCGFLIVNYFVFLFVIGLRVLFCHIFVLRKCGLLLLVSDYFVAFYINLQIIIW